MADRIMEHPILAYLTFALPAVLLVIGLVFDASILLIILTLLWLATAFAVIYVPLADDDSSKA